MVALWHFQLYNYSNNTFDFIHVIIINRSSGILDGSLGSDELLLDDPVVPSDTSTATVTPTGEVVEDITPVSFTAPSRFDTLDRLRASSR